ncbi:MAG: DUF1924 domain-containing protein [Bradyrhizobium sp.]|uniref:DUF1924 domain-containing protein n=1 Tax=Bradyrhizobium sp. TaxID=376 RepID=UPI003D1491E2
MKRLHLIPLLLFGLTLGATAQAATVDELLAEYRAAGAGEFSAGRGRALWLKEFPGEDGQARSCVTCHGRDLTRPGRHVKTNKTIDPLAPSVTPQRLTDRREIEKWFRRNCDWTLGRACTAQEKGDVLSYLRQL